MRFVIVVQSLSGVRLCQASLSTISWNLLKLMSIELVLLSSHLILLSLSPPSLDLSQHQGLSNELTLYQAVKVFELQFQHQSFQWTFRTETGLISLQSKGLSSLLQHHSSKASNLGHSAFFMVQLSHSCMTTGKTVALTRWTFVSKVMSLLFNMLSRSVTAFLPRSKCHLISWLQSPLAVILKPKKTKVCHCFHCFPIYLPWSDGTRCHYLSFLNAEF